MYTLPNKGQPFDMQYFQTRTFVSEGINIMKQLQVKIIVFWDAILWSRRRDCCIHLQQLEAPGSSKMLASQASRQQSSYLLP
jgi:hypothetical protein